MPRFAANLGWLFTEAGFLDRFACARAAGFDAVEFASPYDHPAEAIARALRAHDLACILFNLPMGDKAKGDFGIACRPGREREFREGVARAIDYAKALGCRRVNCISGKALDGDDRVVLRATLLDNLRLAASELAAAGVELVIEPLNAVDVPGFLVPRADDGALVIREAAAPNLGLQFDIYHTAMMGDDPGATFERLLPVIRHVQFADAPGRGEPGTGRIDFPPLFERIHRSGYEGWVSAEYRPSRTTAETLGWRAE